MKSLDFDKRIESLKRRKKILDKDIELLELKRDDERLRGRPNPPEHPKPQVA